MQISFCPLLMIFELQNHFLVLKLLVSSLFKPTSWRKTRTLIYDCFRVIYVNICKSLFAQFQWFVGSKITSWHWKWWFLAFSNLTIEENPKYWFTIVLGWFTYIFCYLFFPVGVHVCKKGHLGSGKMSHPNLYEKNGGWKILPAIHLVWACQDLLSILSLVNIG